MNPINVGAGLAGAMQSVDTILGVANFIENRKQRDLENARQAEADKRVAEMHQWELKTKKLQYADMLDTKRRTEALNGINAIEYHLEHSTATPERVGQLFQQVMPWMAQGNYDGGEKQSFARVLPAKTPGSFIATVFDANGEEKPITRYRSNRPDDEALEIPMGPALEYMSDYKALLQKLKDGDENARQQLVDELRATRVQLGDMSPIEADQAAAQEKLKHDRKIELEGLKSERALSIAKEKGLAAARLESAKQGNRAAIEETKHGYRMAEAKARQGSSPAMQLASAYEEVLGQMEPGTDKAALRKRALDLATKNADDPAKMKAKVMGDFFKALVKADTYGEQDRSAMMREAEMMADEFIRKPTAPKTNQELTRSGTMQAPTILKPADSEPGPLGFLIAGTITRQEFAELEARRKRLN